MRALCCGLLIVAGLVTAAFGEDVESTTSEIIEQRFPGAYREVSVSATGSSIQSLREAYLSIPEHTRMAAKKMHRDSVVNDAVALKALASGESLSEAQFLRDVSPLVVAVERLVDNKRVLRCGEDSRSNDSKLLTSVTQICELVWISSFAASLDRKESAKALLIIRRFYRLAETVLESGMTRDDMFLAVAMIERASVACSKAMSRCEWDSKQLTILDSAIVRDQPLDEAFAQQVGYWLHDEFASEMDKLRAVVTSATRAEIGKKIDAFIVKRGLPSDQAIALRRSKSLDVDATVEKVTKYCRTFTTAGMPSESDSRTRRDYEESVERIAAANRTFEKVIVQGGAIRSTDEIEEVVAGSCNFFGNSLIGTCFVDFSALRREVDRVIDVNACRRLEVLAMQYRLRVGRLPQSWDDIIMQGLCAGPLKSRRTQEVLRFRVENSWIVILDELGE